MKKFDTSLSNIALEISNISEKEKSIQTSDNSVSVNKISGDVYPTEAETESTESRTTQSQTEQSQTEKQAESAEMVKEADAAQTLSPNAAANAAKNKTCFFIVSRSPFLFMRQAFHLRFYYILTNTNKYPVKRIFAIRFATYLIRLKYKTVFSCFNFYRKNRKHAALSSS